MATNTLLAVVLAGMLLPSPACQCQSITSPTLSRPAALALLKSENKRAQDTKLILDPRIDFGASNPPFVVWWDDADLSIPIKLPPVAEMGSTDNFTRSTLLMAHIYAGFENAGVLLKHQRVLKNANGTISIRYTKIPTPDVEWKFENDPFSHPEIHITTAHANAGEIKGIRQSGDMAEAEVFYLAIPTKTQQLLDQITRAVLREQKADPGKCDTYNVDKHWIQQDAWMYDACRFLDHPRLEQTTMRWTFEKWDTGWRVSSRF